MPIANSIVVSDNAYGTIASGLSVSTTALAFTSGHGARFPAVAAGQCLNCCLLNSNNTLEEVIITLHTAGSDSATISRAAGGTTAKAWNAGDRIEARVSSEVLGKLQQEALKGTAITTADGGATYTGTLSQAHLGYVTNMVYALVTAASNSGATPTIALNGLAAISVRIDGQAAIVKGQMPTDGLYQYDGTFFILLNPAFRKGVVQRVYTEYVLYGSTATTIPVDDTVPQISEGVQILAVSITAKSTATKIRATVHVNCTASPSANVTAALFRDAVTDALAAWTEGVQTAGNTQAIDFAFEETSTSTGAVVYSVNVGPNQNAMFINGSASTRLLGGVARCTLIVEEIL